MPSQAVRSGPVRSRRGPRLRGGLLSALVLGLAAHVAPLSHGGRAPASPAPFQNRPVDQSLQRYASGEFDAALDDLTRGPRLEDAVRRFRENAAAWIDGAQPVDRPWRLAVTGNVAVDLVALAVDGKYERQE